MRSLFIYVYAGWLVFKSVPNLIKVKRMPNTVSIENKNEQVFETPKQVSQNVIKKIGVRVHTKGMDKLPDGPVLFVCNHQGLFDILVLLGYAGKPLGFIAKQEIKKIPIIPAWMKQMHCVFIDRTDRRGAIKVINEGIENIKQGQSMVIFPEGTRSRGGKVNEFKSGSLRLGTKAEVPIVPIAIEGTYKILEANDGKIKPADVYLEVCDPIYPNEYKDKKNTELAGQIQMAVERAIQANS
ncbi:1-acyl-sn-glycerol-3-phosphate acyltransferase [Aquibacillus koreensis]|uniref:1-acyl-sn-glycerol-3-phosphate acyltransferase n=1 Tax=Aquibacillus koreensis TaxID=279446 RepID=A0A9X4AKT1_9BACI|nr:lysophospholipid acyltransferase family protein [Aquibacillus koreensis]MCT2534443.1 1-acyl-sn-glycerol-3-phosphate acyltransferase [Aquibacillus koreensis]MDC3421750.1 1-acyl-sn-glycerol-3-phosphate acyltransferase [Aquibacillus koreensis]